MRIDFEWDPDKEAQNARKHGVRFDAAMPIFDDPLARSVLDTDHGTHEERWATIGQGRSGKLLVVVHTFTEVEFDRAVVRIISARPPTRKEARQYREDP